MSAVLELVRKEQATTFEDFWRWYPKKVARKDAEKAWKKLSPAEQCRACEAIVAHVAAWSEEGKDPQFIPYPATWLNRGSYDDDLSVSLPALSQCKWHGCKAIGRHQHGQSKYCDNHMAALKRGETPGR